MGGSTQSIVPKPIEHTSQPVEHARGSRIVVVADASLDKPATTATKAKKAVGQGNNAPSAAPPLVSQQASGSPLSPEERLSEDELKAVIADWGKDLNDPRSSNSQKVDAYNNIGVAMTLLAEREIQAGRNDSGQGYFEEAVAAFRSAVKICPSGADLRKCAEINYNLGRALLSLGEIKSLFSQEGTEATYREALESFDDASTVYKFKDYPQIWADIQNQRGKAYAKLGSVKTDGPDRIESYEKAVAAYDEALKIYTDKKHPREFAEIQNELAEIQSELGGLYSTQADVEDKVINLKKAIVAYQTASNIYLSDNRQREVAAKQETLGGVYSQLAEVENKADNLKKAVAAYNEASQIYTKLGLFYPSILTQEECIDVLVWLGEHEKSVTWFEQAADSLKAMIDVAKKNDRFSWFTPQRIQSWEENLKKVEDSIAKLRNGKP